MQGGYQKWAALGKAFSAMCKQAALIKLSGLWTSKARQKDQIGGDLIKSMEKIKRLNKSVGGGDEIIGVKMIKYIVYMHESVAE